MKIRIRYMKVLCGLSAAAFTLAFSTIQRSAQAQQVIVPGEVLVYFQPGTTQANVQAVAAIVSTVKIVPHLMPGIYEFILPQAANTLAATTAAIAQLKGNANLKWVGGNRIYKAYSNSNSITPNDPLFNEQWPLTNINMPQAYALQKGAVGINIADIDSGFDLTGADLQGRYDVADSYNWGDGNSNIQAGIEDHGVVTSGVMIANTNNAIGVASVCWQNILVVGEKVQSETGTAGSFTLAATLDAYADINNKYKTAHIVAVNMSYGGPGDPLNPLDPEVVALQQLYNDGLILCASAGNGGDPGNGALIDTGTTSPAGIPFVITVSALNQQGTLAWYSSYGKVDIAAPGGGSLTLATTDAAGFLAVRLGSIYNFVNGTSVACPMVTGVAALLMSVPGVTQQKAIKVLLSSANKTGLTTLPDQKYGNGTLDAYNALLQVSASTSILAPIGTDLTTGNSTAQGGTAPPPIGTQKPLMSFNVYNIPPASETFTIDPASPSPLSFTATQLLQNVVATSTPGTLYGAVSTLANVSDVTLVGTTTGTNPQYTISFRYAFPGASVGSHTVQVVGINPIDGLTVTDSVSFYLSPHVIATDSSGVALISIPYYSDAEDTATAQQAQLPAVFPTTLNLYRWLNVPALVPGTSNTVIQGTYAIYGPQHTTSDPGASTPGAALNPTQFVPTLDPSSLGSVSPIGTAYFIQTPAPLTYETYGIDYPSSSFSLPLFQGWNMIGDPYLFSVDFNGMEIQELSGQRITVQAAADANFLLPHVYQYANGDYTFQTLPGGALDPWMGQWIYVLPSPGSSTLSSGVAGYLIIPPAAVAGTSKAATALTPAIQRAVNSQPAVTGAGSWEVQLQAQTGELHDNFNFIGESSRATMGMDSTKVPKPPKAGSYVTLGITHTGLGITGLAQDLLPVGGTRTWQVSVTTTQSRAPMIVSWHNLPTVPRNYKLMLTDTLTNQTVDMRNESSYEFTSAAANSTRSFTLSATPTNGRAIVVVSNISVNPGRTGGRAAGTSEIQYTVSADSNVDVSVLGSNGRVIALVSPTRAVTSGLNSVVWTGQDVNGHTVPGGTYILQIRATDSGGNMTRQIVPLIVTGR